MAIARTKFNINSVMIVNMPFLFLQKEYITGDIFDKDSCAMTKTRSLFNSRRLLAEDDPSCPKVNKAKPAVKAKKEPTAHQLKAAAKKAQAKADKEAEEAIRAQEAADKEAAEATVAQDAADAANEAATGSDADETAENNPWA